MVCGEKRVVKVEWFTADLAFVYDCGPAAISGSRRVESMQQDQDLAWMREALTLAREAENLGEVPVGAVVISEGKVIGRGHNRRERDQDPVAHAEILAIRQAAESVGGWRLEGCTLYVTLEPCAMCAGALVNSRVERLVFGTHDPKVGFCGSLGNLVEDSRLNHRLKVTSGVLGVEASTLLREFFARLRVAGR